MSGPHSSSGPAGGGDTTRHHLVALAVLAVSLTALLTALGAGLVSGAIRVLCLFAACAVVALIVVLLPARFRTTAGSFAAAFVAASGVLPVFLASDDTSSSAPEEPQVHADYLAELVRRGPFTEPLPPPLRVKTLRDVRINDPSASARLDAVWVDMQARGEEGLSVFAMIEVYPSPSAAERRKDARIALHRRIYPGEKVYDNCFDESGAHGGGWTCVAARGYAYAEAAGPGDNANSGLVTGTLTALLRYTDRLTKVAS